MLRVVQLFLLLHVPAPHILVDRQHQVAHDLIAPILVEDFEALDHQDFRRLARHRADDDGTQELFVARTLRRPAPCWEKLAEPVFGVRLYVKLR